MKKPVNWAAIKKRYLTGEKPKDIAADFGLTAKQVSDKANHEGWTRKKSEISAKIENDVLDELEEIHSVYMDLILDTGKQIREARRSGLIGLTIQDGEGYSSKFADNDHKAGLALILERQKHRYKKELAELAKQDPEETETPGFNVSPDA